MVGAMGMGGKLLSYEAIQAGPHNLVSKVLSTDEGRDEVGGVLETARIEVTTLIANNRHIVEALRDALLEHDELVGLEIESVIRDAIAQLA